MIANLDSQHQGQPPSNAIEGFIGASLPGIRDRLQRDNAITELQPNVVILAAGLTDLLQLDANDYAGLNRTRNDLEDLVTFIFDQCENCAVLVGDMPSYPNFSWPPSARQKQRLQFNAMISEVVNKQQTLYANSAGPRHVLKAHFTPSTRDTDGNFPNENGYDRMAYDLEERIWDLAQYGWIAAPSGGGGGGGGGGDGGGGDGPAQGTELRILPLGDSITWGFPPEVSPNGYRLQLRNDLSDDYPVVFAGTERHGTMTDPYMVGPFLLPRTIFLW